MSFVEFKKPIELKEMQAHNREIGFLLDDIEILENGLGCDYSEISKDLADVRTRLEQCKEELQKKE